MANCPREILRWAGVPLRSETRFSWTAGEPAAIRYCRILLYGWTPIVHTSMDLNIPIKTTETVFNIVEALVELDGATGSELTDELDIPTSTVHDHLQSLNRLGFLVRDSDEYHISARFLELGARRRKNMDLYQVAKPELDRLAEETGEHASLMLEENALGVLLYTAKGDNAVQVNTYSGARTKLHMTAPGKAILAHLPQPQLDDVIDRYGLTGGTRNTITNREELETELKQITNRGYAIDRQELFDGMRAVGAPLLSEDGSVLGAISVYGPVNRLNDKRFENDIPDNVLQAANVIEVNLNYS